MRLRILLAPLLVAVALVSAFGLSKNVAEAAPGWQLPWPAGNQQRIDNGNSYGCGDHTDQSRWAIDFWFDPQFGGPVAAAAGGTVVASAFEPVGGWFVDIDHGLGTIPTMETLPSRAHHTER